MDDEIRAYRFYRTSLDMFLSWLALVGSALDRKLFFVADIHEVGYWIAKHRERGSSSIHLSSGTDMRRAYKSLFASIGIKSLTTRIGLSLKIERLRYATTKTQNQE